MNFLDCFNGQKKADNQYTFQLEEKFNGGFGGTNGGVLAALSVFVARKISGDRLPSALDARFIRSFRPGLEVVEATILNEGRSLTVISVDIFSENKKLSTRSTVTLVNPEMLADIEYSETLIDAEKLLPVEDGKVWPQPKKSIPLIDTFTPSYLGKVGTGVATATQVVWDEPSTTAEAACIAADISVGPPVSKVVRGQAGVPNPDLSLRFTGDYEMASHMVSVCKLANINAGLATTELNVLSNGQLVASGVSTTTCIKI